MAISDEEIILKIYSIRGLCYDIMQELRRRNPNHVEKVEKKLAEFRGNVEENKGLF